MRKWRVPRRSVRLEVLKTASDFEANFHLSASDHVEITLIAALVARLLAQAPRLQS